MASEIIWDGERENVIKELRNPKWCYRTSEGVAESVGLDVKKVLIILEILMKEGFVKKSTNNQWALKTVTNWDNLQGGWG